MPLALRTLLVAVALAAGGCQLVTDTGGLSEGDADSGAAADAAAPVSSGSDASPISVTDAAADARDGGPDAPVDAGARGDTGPVVPPAMGEDGGTLPGPPASKCSVDSTIPTTLVIANQSTVTIEIWWVDYACIEHDYGNVDPGGSSTLGTFVTHPWRIRADGTHALLREVPAATDALPRTVTYP